MFTHRMNGENQHQSSVSVRDFLSAGEHAFQQCHRFEGALGVATIRWVENKPADGSAEFAKGLGEFCGITSKNHCTVFSFPFCVQRPL